MAEQKETLMRIEDLHVKYKTRVGWVSAIDGVSMEIRKGEVLGLVGESGCGKSTLGKALLRILPPSTRMTGKLWFQGQPQHAHQYFPQRLRTGGAGGLCGAGRGGWVGRAHHQSGERGGRPVAGACGEQQPGAVAG